MEHQNVIDRFRESALQFPNSTAIIKNDIAYSYQKLDRATDKLASYLQKYQKAKKELCFVFVKSEIAAVEALLGVMKSGKVFVPISHDFTDNGINELIDDYNPDWFVIDQESEERFLKITQERGLNNFNICFQDLSKTKNKNVNRQLSWIDESHDCDITSQEKIKLSPEDACYIYFTSGSTGKPKGVHGAFKGLNHFIDWEINFLGLQQPKVSQFSALTFDVFLRDTFVPLCSGGTLCIPPRNNGIIKIDSLLDWIKEKQINLIHCVPTLFREVISAAAGNENLNDLKYILLAGEKVYAEDVKNWYNTFGDNVQLVNIYGPSETTLAKFAYKIDYTKNQEGEVPLGQPIPGSKAILLDDKLMPVRKGDVGEIYIRTPYRSLGYYKNEELTKKVFIKHPKIKDPNDLLYKTGDLAVINNDGNFEFRGRKDFQVKVKGIRIELTAIEACLRQISEVEDALVIYEEQSKSLAAFIKSKNQLTQDHIQSHISDALPTYMHPLFYLFKDAFPINKNGKTDRKILKAELQEFIKNKTATIDAPANKTEEQLVAIWKEFLEAENIGTNHNFFELGGHSLLATRVAAVIRKKLNTELTVKHLFDNPTIKELGDFIDQQKGEASLIESIKPQERPDKLPLSFAQERIWFLDKLEGSTHYHIPSVLKLNGKLDKDALNFALSEIVERHEILRTTIQDTSGKAWQQIIPSNDWELTESEALNKAEIELKPLIASIIQKPFDISADYMLRAHLMKCSEETHILILVMHHIASDGWSVGMFVNELVALYQSKIKATAPALPELPLQYADYALWQRQHLSEEKLEEKLSFWESKLIDTETLELPTDFTRPAVQSTKGKTIYFSISESLTQKLQKLSHQEGTTLFMTLLTAYKVLLHRYTSQEDICVGTPIANRAQEELSNLIGFFVNTLALRTDLSENPTFKELLANVKANTLEAYEYQDVPFEKIVDRVAKNRDMSRNPLFQTMFVLQNNPAANLELGEISLSGLAMENKTAKFDLTFNVNETDHGLHLGIEYCTDLFSETRIKKMFVHFENLLKAVVSDTQKSIGSLEMLDEEEINLLVNDFNFQTLQLQGKQNVIQLFEKQVQKAPEQIAIKFEKQSVTYKQLAERANQLANALLAKGAQKDDFIALIQDRSVDMIASILAVLKMGGTYLPIDPEYPEERINFMLEDTNSKFILTSEKYQKVFGLNDAIKVLTVEAPEIKSIEINPPKVNIISEDVAYVIYTSGTTGKPKGVLIQHGSLINLIKGQTNNFGINEADVILQFSNYIFDASIEQIFLALCNGAQLVLPTKENLLNPQQLDELIKRDQITHLDVTPSFLKTMVPSNYPHLKRVVAGGEYCPPSLAETWSKQLPFYNVYGPTETTITSLSYQVDADTLKSGNLPIGKPLLNTTAYILNQALKTVPIGTPGQLYIGGAGLAKGYLNNEQLTNERFIPNPFNKEQKLYATGDLVKWQEDGNIAFLGRIDQQVKMRGFRIELEEIESVLLQISGINQAVTHVFKDQNDNQKLVAYVVSEGNINQEEITSYLKSKLPSYMVPQSLVQIDSIPLTPSGKVNKKALPLPTEKDQKDNFKAASNQIEKDLVAIWAELLSVKNIGVQDNFFELGGDSIITIQVVSRANKLGYVLQARDLFQYQTIEELANAIVDREKEITAEQGLLRGEVPLLPIQKEFLELNSQERNHYNQAVLLEIGKDFTKENIEKVVNAIVNQHDALRLKFEKANGVWKQSYIDSVDCIEVEDLRNEKEDESDLLINEICEKYQKSLDLEQGKVFKAILIQTPESKITNRLFLVAHHMVVDGVSWRVLLEQFEESLHAIQNGKTIDLGIKSSSYREWGLALQSFANSPKYIAQKEHWQSIFENWEALPTDINTEIPSMMQEVETTTAIINKTLTTCLLKNTNKTYNTEINDILLSALAKTIKDFSHQSKVVIGLEGHGREEIAKGIDTSSTVGWFTNLYPIALELNEQTTPDKLIPSVKEQLRMVPEKGIGYGILKSYHQSEELRDSLSHYKPEIIFNYLGQLDNVIKEEGLLKGASENSGKNASPKTPFQAKIEINGAITEGKLRLSWNYSKKEYHKKTIEVLAENFNANLKTIIEHCQSIDQTVITPSDYQLSPEIQFQELNEYLHQDVNGKKLSDQISSIYRLSPMQEGMLFHSLFETESEAYIEQMAVELPYGIDATALEKSWNFILQNHSILRSKFLHKEFSIPVQVALKEVTIPFEIIDFSSFSTAVQQVKIKEFLAADKAKGFQFDEAPLMRISLIKLGDLEHQMVWTSHHILTDGWSIPVLMGELLQAYQAYASGQSALIKKEDKYEDFIRHINQKDQFEEEAFWSSYMEGIETPTLLPFVENVPDRNKGKGTSEEITLKLGKEFTNELKNYAQKYHLTANTIVQGIWSLLLSKYTRNKDVVFGVTVSGRPSDLQKAEEKVGLYINTLPLRTQIQDDVNLPNWLSEIQESQTSSREYQHAALTDIQRLSGMQGDLFDSILVFENHPMGDVHRKDWLLKIGKIHSKEQSNYLLNVIVSLGDEMIVKFNYNNYILKEQHISMVKGHFENVIKQVINKPEIKIPEIKILTDVETKLQVTNYNDTLIDYPEGKLLHQLFEKQALITPYQTALVYDGVKLSYQELNEKANKLANFLISKGLPKNGAVPLVSHKSADQVWGVLGILKAGGFYIPIKGDLPKTRINELIQQTEAQFILAQEDYISKIDQTENSEVIHLDESTFAQESEICESVKVKETDLAYIIFTSGSTGKPKGVMIDHRGAVNTLYDMNARFNVTSEDKVFGVSELNFDLSVYDIFGTLACGATLVLPKEQEIHDPAAWLNYVEEEQVTVWDSVPQLMGLLVDQVEKGEEHRISSLRICWMSGDWIPLNLPEKIWKINPEMELISLGGATEGSIWSIHYPIKEVRPEWQSIPYGYPLANQEMYVLDEHLNPCPLHIPGAIYIGGKGVAKGYYKNAEKTASHFIYHPEKKETIYRTGDLGYYHPEGYIVFVGRLDTQVKVNGYRIELGEIETVLQQSELVDQCVVIVKETTQSVKRLVAYIVPNGKFDKNAIQTYLQSRLPEYMVPSIIMEISEMPLTSNGKVNKKDLPEPDGIMLNNQNYIEPRDEFEAKIADIWQKLLGIDQIGVYDNFFELGGHSLLATRVVSAIRKQLNTELAIRILFEKPNIASLAAHMNEQKKGDIVPALSPQKRPEFIPLSFAQERLWFIDQLDGSSAYHIPAAFGLTGEVDKNYLEEAFKLLVNRHEVLRTRLQQEGGIPYQEIIPENRWKLEYTEDATLLNDHSKRDQWIATELSKPFDLSKDHMLRAHLIKGEDEQYILLLVMHHIASDGWSVSVFVEELKALYNGLISGNQVSLPELPLQYADYAIWQRNYLNGAVLEQKLSYWKEKLSGVKVLNLQTDHARPAIQSSKGKSFGYQLNNDLSKKVVDLSKNEGTTLFMTLLSAFKVLLHKYTGQEDICVGSPIANRTHQETEALIGFFVNTLALRSEVSGEATFSELLEQVKTTTLDAYANQEIPFEKIVQQLDLNRDMSHSPVFQVMFVLQNNPEVAELNLGSADLSPIPYGDEVTKYDLTLHVNETAKGLHLGIEYCSDLFEESNIKRMMSHFEALLSSIVASPKAEISAFEMLSDEEEEIIGSFEKPSDKPFNYQHVVSQFESAVAETPKATAVIFGNKKISFEELNKKANQLAYHLSTKGVYEGDYVIMACEHSAEMMIAIWAIMKAGAVYVPIDPEHPLKRINYIIQDTKAKLVISDKESTHLFYGHPNLEIVTVDGKCPWKEEKVTSNIGISASENDMAYVIYTSGSTGKPKGTLVTHGNLSAYLSYATSNYISDNENKSGSFIHFSNTFDASLTAIFAPLIMGKQVVVSSTLSYEVFNEPNLLKYAPYDFIKLTPAHLEFLKPVFYKGKNKLSDRLVIGGEALHPKDFQYLSEHKLDVEIINEYGPTETTVGCTAYSFRTGSEFISSEAGVSIGKPIDHVSVRILDQHGHPAPVGISGELFIEGLQVSKGYLNNVQLSEEKFTKTSDGTRLYSSGDIARWLPDGNIEFLGRKDEQVKIRGFRIEPGEIAAIIQNSGLVSQAIVTPQYDQKGELILTAYIIPHQHYTKQKLKLQLEEMLPDYMIPNQFISISKIPLTANGKVDKKALPAPQVSYKRNGFIAARNPIEESLSNIWKKLLQIDKIGVKDDFFELGGHSLLAMRIVSEIKDVFEVTIDVKDIFLHPTIEKQAIAIQKQDQQDLLPEITAYNTSERVPLSFSQERLWFLDKLQGSNHYHMPVVFRWKGALGYYALETSLKEILMRHESLRTVVKEEKGQAYQETIELDDWHILKGQTKDNPEDIFNALEKQIHKPFDLSKDIKLRVQILELEDKQDEYLILIVMHHIASDGWSISVLVNELTELYNSLTENRNSKLKPLEIQYSDYTQWQRNYLSGKLLDEKLQFWENKLSGIEPLNLPTDFSRPAIQSTKGKTVSYQLNQNISNEILELTKKEGATLFMSMLSAFKVLLYRYSGQEDICVGTPVANRMQNELDPLIGFFANTLALRSHIKEEDSHESISFSKLLSDLKKNTLESFKHQDVPFEKIVDRIEPTRDLSHSPIFQTMFVLHQQHDHKAINLGEVSIKTESFEYEIAKFDLTLFVNETPEGIKLDLEYCTELFKESTVTQMLQHFDQLIKSIISDPDKSIDQLPMITEVEQKALVQNYNDTKVALPSGQTLSSIFEEQVSKTPNNIALTYDGVHYTYSQLDEKANQIAHYLEKIGDPVNAPIPLVSHKSAAQIWAVLGILKVGGHYIPIKGGLPETRINELIEQTEANIVIVQPEYQGKLKTDAKQVILEESTFENEAKTHQLPTILETDLAYIIFTSGSTGKPKGVMIDHRGAVNTVLDMNQRFQITEADKVLGVSELNFDLSVYDIFGTFACGATLVLPKEEEIHAPLAWLSYIEKEKVTLWDSVPQLMSLLVDHVDPQDKYKIESLRMCWMSGDWIPLNLPEKIWNLNPEMEVISLGGATEGSIWSIHYPIKKVDSNWQSIPYGYPLGNQQMYILNDALQPCPPNIPGGIYIGGKGVAKGYHKDEEKTANSFIYHPEMKQVIYKTGDMGYYHPEGYIVFAGRLDTQVKVNGYRIELGEIETVLQQSSMVAQCVVDVKSSGKGAKRLVAYIVPQGDFDKESILLHLTTRLPEYMVPTLLVEIEEIPLTANGKVNKKELPDPENSRIEISTIIPPKNETEERLVAIWKELLGIQKLSTMDNFFELGGNSMMAVKLMATIHKEFGIQLPIATLFKHPLITSLSEQLISKDEATKEPILISFNQGKDKLPVFCAPPAGGNVMIYQDLARLLGDDQPFYAFQSHGLDGKTETLNSIEAMATAFIEEMQKVQPEGPYQLAGYSFGAKIIYEMAHQLKNKGFDVSQLIIFDASAPEQNPEEVIATLPSTREEWLYSLTKELDTNGNTPLLALNDLKEKSEEEQLKVLHHKLTDRGDEITYNQLKGLTSVYINNTTMKYTPQYKFSFKIPVTLFKARETAKEQMNNPNKLLQLSDYGWEEHTTAKVKVFDIACNHRTILSKGSVEIIAKKLKTILASNVVEDL